MGMVLISEKQVGRQDVTAELWGSPPGKRESEIGGNIQDNAPGASDLLCTVARPGKAL
jgi:hypothetical protein